MIRLMKEQPLETGEEATQSKWVQMGEAVDVAVNRDLHLLFSSQDKGKSLTVSRTILASLHLAFTQASTDVFTALDWS